MNESEAVERQARRLVDGVRVFAEAMQAAGIHVGMGRDPRCVCCGEAWPCEDSRPKPEEHTE